MMSTKNIVFGKCFNCKSVYPKNKFTYNRIEKYFCTKECNLAYAIKIYTENKRKSKQLIRYL